MVRIRYGLFRWLFGGFNNATREGSLLEDSLGSYDGTVLGSFDGTKYEGSTLVVSPENTEGKVLGYE